MKIFLICAIVIVSAAVIFLYFRINNFIRYSFGVFDKLKMLLINDSKALGICPYDILEEYDNCNMLTLIHYNSEESKTITDLSLLESHNLVGLEIFETKSAPEGYVEEPILFEDVLLQRIRPIGSDDEIGTWIWLTE